MFQGKNILESMVNSWYESLKNPENHQKLVLSRLISQYSKTRYGQAHHASHVKNVTDFRLNFPVVNYKSLNPYFAKVVEGDYSAILPEPILCWVMTRGSTGKAKVFPVTKTHIQQIFVCGARALVNYVLRKQDFELLKGRILNLNFPSSVHTMIINGKEVKYGYSSGTYAKLNPMLNELSLIPRQEDIDALGSGITKSDWERRFELVYQQGVDKDVTAAIGVTPMIFAFARYMNRKHGKTP